MNLFSPQISLNREMFDQRNVNVNVYENEMNQMYVQSGLNWIDNYGEFVDMSQLENQKPMFTSLGEDISMQMHQQQLEIDRFISQHMDKMRSEIEANRRAVTLRLIALTTKEQYNKLRSKEDEIVKMRRLNYALEQKVKSLHVDNQIWQQMAQTNEATTNVLRYNLQQILTQVQQHENIAGDIIEDVESCCGSNYNYHDEQRMLANMHEDKLASMQGRKLVRVDNGKKGGGDDVDGYWVTVGDNNCRRLCRNCGKEELCVLLLPCRHLCVCTVCESSINVCPVCKSTKNASLHVNMNLF